MGRYELTAEQFALIEPFLPKNGGRGKQWKDHRTVLNGIFYRCASGCPWRDVPERYGNWKTIANRYREWAKDGTIGRIMAALQVKLDEKGLIDWELWSIDGTNIRASRAAAGARKKGAPESRKTTHLAARAAGLAPSSTWLLRVEDSRSTSASRQAKPTNPRKRKRS